jgi:hypothetical protein
MRCVTWTQFTPAGLAKRQDIPHVLKFVPEIVGQLLDPKYS